MPGVPPQPFQYRDARLQVARKELAGLLAQVDENRARFENADWFSAGPFRIDNRRNLAARADLQEFGLELLPLAKIDDLDGVRKRHFLQGNADLATIRRIEGVEFNCHGRNGDYRKRGPERP